MPTSLPQVVEVLKLIFEPPDNQFPTVEELVLCDLFRNIDLREMRGPSISVKKFIFELRSTSNQNVLIRSLLSTD